MSEKYKVIDSTVPTFVTITVVDWVDLLIRPVYCNTRMGNMQVLIWVWVTTPDVSDMHQIFSSTDGAELHSVPTYESK